MKTTLLLAAAWSLLPGGLGSEATAVGQSASTAERVTITVHAQPRQTFKGLGASCYGGRDYMRLSLERRAHLNDLVWRQARFNTMRIWLNLRRYAPAPGERHFRRAFSNGAATLVRNAEAAGVKHLVVGPADMPAYLMVRLPTIGHDGNGQAIEPYPKPGQFKAHAAIIADFIRDLSEKDHLTIQATGIQNEPNDPKDCVFTPADVVRSVKALRAALDARGLQKVQIIAPESVGCNAPAWAQAKALRTDPAAWNALGGLASHDYDGGPTEQWANLIADTGKGYWMTEYCIGGPEDPGDCFRGAAEASAFLSDMNHRVNYWIHFIGYLSNDPHDNGTRLIAYSLGHTAGDAWLKIFEPYYYLKRLSETFDVGAVFRQSMRASDKEMTWTHRHKPPLVVAAARNPDGSWGIALCDYTANDFPAHFWYPGQHAQSFTVTVKVEELARRGNIRFATYRIGPRFKHARREGMSTMHHGQLTVTVHPLELVTLRSSVGPPLKKD